MEMYTKEWFGAQSQKTEFVNLKKEADQQRKEFLDKFGYEKIKDLDDTELLETLFINSSQEENMCSWLLSKKTNIYVDVTYGSMHTFGLFYDQANNPKKKQNLGKKGWTTGPAAKEIKITEDDAVIIARKIRDGLVSISKFLQKSFEEIDYSIIKDEFEKYGISISARYIKYLAISFPDKIPCFYTDKWHKAVFNKLGFEWNTDIFVRLGMISKFIRDCQIDPIIFANILYKNMNVEYVRKEFKDYLLKNGVSHPDNYISGIKTIQSEFVVDFEEEYLKDKCESLREKINLMENKKGNRGNWPTYFNRYLDFLKTTGNEDITANPSSVNCSKYANTLLKSSNIIFRGAPGTGKSYLAKEIAADIVSKGEFTNYSKLKENGLDKQVEFVQFHPSYDYSDFVEGLRPVEKANNTIGFKLEDGIFKKFVRNAKSHPEKQYVFIIDEINRGEISKIFGELFYSIEPSKRGKTGEIATQYANMHSDDEELFYIPENVYIIGTMNDIDRSVDSFDFAMRRRFKFIEITSEESQTMLDIGITDFALREEAKTRMNRLNNAIDNVPELDSNYHIGASYFMNIEKESDFKELWIDSLKPLLQEYIVGTYTEKTTMTEFKNAYFGKKDGAEDESDETNG